MKLCNMLMKHMELLFADDDPLFREGTAQWLRYLQ
jgi:hypothetical protein